MTKDGGTGKRLGIGWTLDPRRGDGRLAQELALQLVRKGRQVLFREIADPLDTDPLSLRLLSPAREHGVTPSPDRAGAAREPFPVLQPFGGGFAPGRRQALSGTPEVGLARFERVDFSPADRDAARRLPLLLAGSYWNAQVLRSLGLDNVLHCPPGVDTALFRPAPRAGYFPGRFLIYSGGPLAYAKGQDLVLAAFRSFRQRHPEALLVCDWAGGDSRAMHEFGFSRHVDGPPPLEDGRARVQTWLARNGIPPEAVWVLDSPGRSELPAILRECHVALFPGRCEGEGGSLILQAMACGLPAVIAGNTGHLDFAGDQVYLLREQADVSALLGDPGKAGWGESSVDELLAMLERIHARPEEAQRKGRAAAREAENRSWDRQIEHLLKAIDAAAVGRRPRNAADEGYAWGNRLHRVGRLADARDMYEAVLRRQPGHVGARADRANVLRDQGDLAAAEADLRLILAQHPDNTKILQGLGVLLRLAGRLEESAACLRRALDLSDTPFLHWNLAYTLLLAGQYAEAWPHFEQRHAALGLRSVDPAKPRWDGAPLTTGTLLVLDEQGLGDSLQFLRFLPRIPKQPGARVIFACKPAVLAVARRVLPAADVYAWDGPLPRTDAWVPLMSLPARLGVRRPEQVPPPPPGTLCEAARVAEWRRPVRGDDDRPVVALCWAGNPDFSGDAWRSPGLAVLRPLLQAREALGLRFVSLQVGAGRRELAQAASELALEDLGARVEARGGEVLDTLAILANCDFVVSSCTSVAHMAGLAGIPGCIMLSTRPDWRWMTERSDSPWYPSLRLIRQQVQGNWTQVAAEVLEQVRAWRTKTGRFSALE